MYTCRICNFVSEAGQPQYKHIIYREDNSISREIPVCFDCKDDLDAGIPLKLMLQEHGVYKAVAPPPVKVVEPVKVKRVVQKPIKLPAKVVGKPIKRQSMN